MKYKVAVIQLDSQGDLDENLKQITLYIEEAVLNGAKLISLPENMNQISGNVAEIVVEEIPGKTIKHMSSLAKKNKIWIHCGSIKELNKNGNAFNTTIMLDPNGDIIGKYQKLHLFNVDLIDNDNKKSIRESDWNAHGDEIINISTEIGNLGFTICYDLRFPELFRVLTLRGADIIFVPANFTYQTGKAHWSTLLRARAIENGCFIIAAAQTGIKPLVSVYGHSMIIDPWGDILAEADENPSIIYAEIDLDKVSYFRNQIPSLKNRRDDVYSILVNNNSTGGKND